MVITIPDDAIKTLVDAGHIVADSAKVVAKNTIEGAKKGGELGVKLGSQIKKGIIGLIGFIRELPGTKIEIKVIKKDRTIQM